MWENDEATYESQGFLSASSISSITVVTHLVRRTRMVSSGFRALRYFSSISKSPSSLLQVQACANA